MANKLPKGFQQSQGLGEDTRDEDQERLSMVARAKAKRRKLLAPHRTNQGLRAAPVKPFKRVNWSGRQ